MDTNKKTGIIVGLTGQTGAGKSMVSEIISGRGYKVIDADVVSRRIVEAGGQCLLDLAIEFGIDILNEDGSLNRKRLSGIVFRDKDKLQKLNEVTHPYIIEEIGREARELIAFGEPAVFIDAPTLFESGGNEMCNKTISVLAPQDVRLGRIRARDKLTQEDALARINSQPDDEFYESRSDFVVKNGSDLSHLRFWVTEMFHFLGLPQENKRE